ncbi:MAG TPA: aspartate kinase [Candidatus Limnocylindria bacterium]|nr:aspartate kinase [Candidatus Limnocylindria bacterium]
MAVLVQKYGGTSVDGPERLRAVARRVAAARLAGHELVVVVSAMGRTTDELIRLAHQVSRAPSRRELDMLLTTGERVTMALLAMALQDLEVQAISFTGSQSGILTTGDHNAARIVDVRPDRIRAELARDQVVIVAGFQGVNPQTKEITTLGRGGSDTSAVALAASLGGACEIYTDVSGVYSGDPRVVPAARPIPQLSYRSCSTLAHLGGRVLHARCVDLAARARVPLTVRSSFDEQPGTRIVEDQDMEGARVEAVTHRGDCSVVVAEGTSGARGEARGIIADVATAFPELELVAHEQTAGSQGAHGALVWMGSRSDAEALQASFRELRGPGGEWKIGAEHDAGFVSVIGYGLGAAHVVAAEVALERAGIPLVALRVTPSAIIFRVAGDRVEPAARALHAALLE